MIRIAGQQFHPLRLLTLLNFLPIYTSLAYSVTCYMLYTKWSITGFMLYILPIIHMQLFGLLYYLLYASYYMLHYRRRTKLLTNFSTTLLYMLHTLLQATYSTFILASPDSVRLTGLLCRISHRISTDTFLSCTLILTPLKLLLSPSGDLGIGLVWDNLSTTTFRSDCWNPLQTELNHLWWVLSCS